MDENIWSPQAHFKYFTNDRQRFDATTLLSSEETNNSESCK